MIYTGIGSRQTPEDILDLMEEFAGLVADDSVLRSGAAKGADKAFERGAISAYGQIEIFLPWKGFEGCTIATMIEPEKDAFILAAEYHPNWKWLKQGAKKLIARDGYQVLGCTLDMPSDLVVCYTENGSVTGQEPKTGGTGQALRIATDYKIPVLNLQREDHRKELLEWV